MSVTQNWLKKMMGETDTEDCRARSDIDNGWRNDYCVCPALAQTLIFQEYPLGY
ncbi:MAG: hypothetical protein KME50_12580 [Nostoc desertorum CM1-VF14]|nr:hypothetical protein [Nostoc desertorum CM1-VF14]